MTEVIWSALLTPCRGRSIARVGDGVGPPLCVVGVRGLADLVAACLEWLLRVALKRAKGLPAEWRMPDRSAIDFRVHVGSEVPQVRSGYYTAGRSNQRHSFAELVQHWLLE